MTGEIGFSVCRTPGGKLTHGPIAAGTPTSVDIPVTCPPGSQFEGLFHTHPGGSPKPSATDLKSGEKVNAKYLCIEADGKMQCHVRRKK